MTDASAFASLGSVDDLRALLLAGGLDLSLWGNDSAKSVDDLWAEIEADECRMRAQPLQRVLLGVVNVQIRRGERELIEIRQVFASGLTRPRDIRPSEKMKPGERPSDTAIRCLREELGTAPEDIDIVAASPPRCEARLSPSYPGLATEYTFYTVEAQVSGLPDGDFTTYEYDADGRTWIMRHDWAWLPR